VQRFRQYFPHTPHWVPGAWHFFLRPLHCCSFDMETTHSGANRPRWLGRQWCDAEWNSYL